MALEKVSPRLSGYNPEQVDALMDRIRRQYENPGSRIIIPSMLAAVRFDFSPGGYRIEQVDEAIAQVAEDFDKREIERRLERIGIQALAKEVKSQLKAINDRLSKPAGERFSPARNGYSGKVVNRLLSELLIEADQLKGPPTMDIRTRPLGTSRGGPSRLEVNEFLALVVGVIHRQQLIASK
jgi:DivIVA domain-containing protein